MKQMSENNSRGSLPKIAAVRGSLHLERKRCGRPNCRCARGQLHGPYWYRRWREGGRQRKGYVSKGALEHVQAAIELRRQLQPPAWSMQQALAELSQLSQEVVCK